MCEINIDWLLSYTPQMGSEPTTQSRALTGNPTGDLSVCQVMPNQLSHTSQSKDLFLKVLFLNKVMNMIEILKQNDSLPNPCFPGPLCRGNYFWFLVPSR